MNFLQKVLLYQGWKVRYWTAWTTTTTTLASSWGLLINIDSATGDVPQTASGWIEDEKYGFYAREFATSTQAQFKTGVITWEKVLRLETLDATWVCRVLQIAAPNYSTAATNLANSAKLFPVKASTKYKFKFKWKWVWITGGGMDLPIFNSSGTYYAGWTSISFSNTSDFIWYTTTFTTDASAVWFWWIAFIAAWSAWTFDIQVNSMTLEEVVEPVANSLTSSSPSLVSFTAVGSTDNIDQSFTTAPDQWRWVWNFSWNQYRNAQSFTATKSKLTWVYLWKRANSWTPTGNLKIDIQTDSAWNPSWTILATYTIPLATYNALTTTAEFLINLPCNLTAWTKYHIVATNTATEASWSFFNLWALAAWGYTWGDNRYSLDWWAWVVNATADMYFKTLYYKPTTNFKASQNNSTVSISADEDGFLHSSKLDLTTWAFTYTDSITTWDTANNNYYDWNAFDFSTNRLNFSWAWKYLTLKVNTWLPVNWDLYFENGWMHNVTCSYSFDNSSWTTLFTQVSSAWSGNIPMAWANIVYVRLYANATSSWGSIVCNWTIDTSSLSTLRNYPTNKDVIKQYSTTLWSATTSATYRATKWGFPAIEYSATEYQFLDVDTTATGSTVAFSELWTTYTTVADWASLAITSTSTPNIFVKANITANRLYLSSNDYSASSDKDWSLKQSVVYSVIQ